MSRSRLPYTTKYFNPRSREGSDFVTVTKLFLSLIFQSALPRGERPGSGSWDAIMPDFNPRSREGSDPGGNIFCKVLNHFNPRSREGSDLVGDRYGISEGIFQSALPRGERHDMGKIIYMEDNFNPRSREGSDTQPLCKTLSTTLFQSALPRGERRLCADASP